MRKLFTKERLAGALTPMLIILAAFLFISILLLAIGMNPLTTYGSMISGAFGSGMGLINTITKTVPICLCAMGVAIARQAGIFNIGLNGQMMVGAVGTVIAGVYLKGLPMIVHVPLALLAGMLFAVVYALFPTIAYIKRGVNLIVIFILTNNMANKLITWAIFSFLRDPESQSNATYRVENSAILPNLLTKPGRLNIGVLIMLVIVVIMYIYSYKTTSGFEMRACGSNRIAAEYAGINSARYLSSSLLIGAALAGLAGGIEVLGTYYRLYDGFSPAYGFDGIPIALLSGGNPIGIVIGSFVFGALRVGSANMQIKVGVSSELVSVIQGVLICFIALEYIFRFAAGKIVSGKSRHRKEAASR